MWHPPALPPPAIPVEGASLPLEVGAHVRTRGDMMFRHVPWAGRVATGLWIESFMVRPLEVLQAGDLEYKGLTGSGFETPWLSDGIMRGTKGLSVPLVGFAIRLKPGREAVTFECEYSGYFKSGVTVGPLKNGTPCRSTVANDPLEGLQVAIRKRGGAAAPTPKAPAVTARRVGPSFGRFREGNGHDAPAPPVKHSVQPAAKARRGSSPAKRPASRPTSRRD